MTETLKRARNPVFRIFGPKMTATAAARGAAGSAAWADALLLSFAQGGYVQAHPGDPAAGRAVPRPVRRGHPQAHVSDRPTPTARELCLRPDLTIPVSRDYLASPAAGRPRASATSARCFAIAATAGARFVQAGIESFGRPDKAAADAEMLALGLEATAHYGIAKPEIRIGDVGLFAALVAALDLAPAWKRRLVKDFNRKTILAHDLDG